MTFAARDNPRDPIKAAGAPDSGADLFAQMARACNGHGSDAVESAAANLLINALRQRHATAGEAEDAFDRIVANAKAALLGQHYRPGRFGARLSGVFAFRQDIVMPTVSLKKQ
jgi:hypothetical protein